VATDDQAVQDAAAQAEQAAQRAEAAQREAEQAEDAAEGSEQGARQAQLAATEAARESVDAASAISPDDPLLDTAVRKIEAQATEEQPYGVPGPPTSRWSPFRIGFFGGLGFLAAYGLVGALQAIQSVLVLLVISAFLAVGLNPVVESFERRGIPRGRAVGIVLVGVLLAFTGFLFAIVPPIIEQTQQFIKEAPNYLADLKKNSTVRDLDDRFHIIKQATDFVQSPDLAASTFGGVLGVGKVVFGAVFSVITVLTLTLYFMSSLPNMKAAAYRAVPRSRRARVGLLADDILERVGGYVAGALTIALCAGVSSFIVLLATGMPYPVALALVVALTDLVPVIGATIGAIVVSAVAFTEDLRTGLIVAIFYLIYQQVENYLLYPRIMKRSVNVSPAVTIVAVLVGGGLLGIVGALLAIPIAAAIQLILAEVVVPRQDAA
jgi:predicted PurR-regulated permease PerM